MITIRTKEEVEVEQNLLSEWRSAVKILTDLCITDGINDESTAKTNYGTEFDNAVSKAASVNRDFNFSEELISAKAVKTYEERLKTEGEA